MAESELKPVIMRRRGAVTREDITVYKVQVVSVTVAGQLALPVGNTYYASTGSSLDFELNIVDDGGVVQSDLDDIGLDYPPLKIPMFKVVNGVAAHVVNEAYINAQLRDGVLTGTFSAFPSSGNWQIQVGRINDALASIGANWRVEHDDFIFLV